MVFGQIALKVSMFWTAALLTEAMCYRGILEITFWTAASGIADAGLALLGCSLPHVLPVSVLPVCRVHHPCSVGCLVQEWASNIQNTFFHFLPNKLQLLCYCQVSRPWDFSLFQCFKCFISHVSNRFLLKSLTGLSSQGRTLWKNVCTVPFQVTSFNHLY